jgi:peptidoglycan biosynthesis protein MviN/MurJ (putative lipid II flippase)
MNSANKTHLNFKNKILKIFFHPSSKSVLILTFFTFFSRFLGFVRQFFVYNKLEPIESDLLLSANKIPEFLATFLLMGTVYSSVLPIASKFIKNPDTTTESEKDIQTQSENISQYLNLMMFFLISIIGFLALLIVIFTKSILQIFTSHEVWTTLVTQGYLNEYIWATRIMCLIPILSAIQSIFGVFLNLKKKFFIFSIAGVITNLGTILGLIVSQGNIVTIAIFMVLGWLVTDILFLINSLQINYKLPTFNIQKKIQYFKLHRKEIIKTWQLFLPRIFLIDGFYGASLMLNFIFTQGQNTAFDIGTSISGAFFVIVISLATVAFPDLALTLNQPKQGKNFWLKFKKYLLATFSIGLVVTLLAIILSPIVMWFFELLGRGQGNADYITLIAQISALSLFFRSGKEILIKYIFAKEKIWQPIILSFVSVFFQGVFVFGFYHFNQTQSFNIFFLNDSGLLTATSLIVYNFVWLVIASVLVLKDYKEDKKEQN